MLFSQTELYKYSPTDFIDMLSTHNTTSWQNFIKIWDFFFFTLRIFGHPLWFGFQVTVTGKELVPCSSIGTFSYIEGWNFFWDPHTSTFGCVGGVGGAGYHTALRSVGRSVSKARGRRQTSVGRSQRQEAEGRSRSVGLKGKRQMANVGRSVDLKSPFYKAIDRSGMGSTRQSIDRSGMGSIRQSIDRSIGNWFYKAVDRSIGNGLYSAVDRSNGNGFYKEIDRLGMGSLRQSIDRSGMGSIRQLIDR